MTTSTTAVSSFKGQTFARRKSRTLVGWLPENEGALWVAGRQMSQAPDPAHIAVCRAAREAVSKRPAGCDQANIFAPLPDALNAHLAALQAHWMLGVES